MKSLLATLPLALLGMTCGQDCRADPISFECCSNTLFSPTIDFPDAAGYVFGSTPPPELGPTIAILVPTSNASDAAGLMAIEDHGDFVHGSGTITDQIPGEILTFTFPKLRFLFLATAPLGIDKVVFGYNTVHETIKRPIPTPATTGLLLIGLGGLWLFAPKRAA